MPDEPSEAKLRPQLGIFDAVAMVLALGTATALYLLVAVTVISVLGTSRLSHSTSPLEDTMVLVGSGVGVAIISAGALLTTFNEGLSD
jgi:APA family basic amino acid/polyamine antiporter